MMLDFRPARRSGPGRTGRRRPHRATVLRHLLLAGIATLALGGLPVASVMAATRIDASADAAVIARRPGPSLTSWRVPVAMYHIVTPLRPDTANTALFVRSSEFDAQLKAAAADGIRTITAHDLGASIAARIAIPAKVMVLSFDDGRAELIKYAWPIMQKYGSSLVFTGRGWLPLDRNRDGVPDRGYIGTFYVIPGEHGGHYLTYDQWAVLAAAGNEIGDHTLHHVDLRTLHGTQLTDALLGAARTIQSELAIRGISTTVATLAYPFGFSSGEAVQLLRLHGYTVAFTTVEGIAHTGEDLLLLPRVRIARGETPKQFMVGLGW